jgi:hypothetical protein
VVVAAAYSLAAVIVTHPLWLHLDSAVPSDIGDPLLNAWALGWSGHALVAGPARLFDANIFYPLPNTLAYSEHMLATALLALPLQGVTGEPLVAYNVSLLLSFVLGGLGMYWLCLRWTRCRSAAFVAGLAFAFAPYRLAAISHLQLLTLEWLPFSLLAFDRLADRAARPNASGRAATAAGLVVLFSALQVLSSWYLAVFSGLAGGVYVLARLAVVRRWAHIVRLLAWLAVCGSALAAIVAPVAVRYLDVLPQLQAARPAELATTLAARPGDFLAAAPFLRLAGPLTAHFRARDGFTEEHCLYPGILIVLLALTAIVSLGRRKSRDWSEHMVRILALTAIALIAVALTFDGPHQLLVKLFPLFGVVRVPARWMIPAAFAMAGLAGYGLAWLMHAIAVRTRTARRPDRWRHAMPRVVGIIAGVWLLAESVGAPLPLAEVGATREWAPVYRVLQHLAMASGGPPGAVVELPLHVAPAPEYPETRRMLASRLGWWGLVNGYSGFTPPRQTALGNQLADFPSSRSLVALRDLAASGVRYLVVHPGEAPFDRENWQAAGRLEAERSATLYRVGDFGPDVLYAINPYGDALITDPAVVHDPYWSAHLPTPVGYTFTTGHADIRLLAYYLAEVVTDPAVPPPAQPVVRLTLYWQATAPLNKEYTVFVHSLDADGVVSGQADAPPLGNRYPTTAWLPGEIVQDSRTAPAGHAYRVGLYDAASGDRLAAHTPDGARALDDAVTIPVPGARPE